MKKELCPACGCINPSTQHLVDEYCEMLKAGFNDVFGKNARQCRNQIVDMLLLRNITHIPNIFFGSVKISKWTY